MLLQFIVFFFGWDIYKIAEIVKQTKQVDRQKHAILKWLQAVESEMDGEYTNFKHLPLQNQPDQDT
jgi:hypothetical protein